MNQGGATKNGTCGEAFEVRCSSCLLLVLPADASAVARFVVLTHAVFLLIPARSGHAGVVAQRRADRELQQPHPLDDRRLRRAARLQTVSVLGSLPFSGWSYHCKLSRFVACIYAWSILDCCDNSCILSNALPPVLLAH